MGASVRFVRCEEPRSRESWMEDVDAAVAVAEAGDAFVVAAVEL